MSRLLYNMLISTFLDGRQDEKKTLKVKKERVYLIWTDCNCMVDLRHIRCCNYRQTLHSFSQSMFMCYVHAVTKFF